MLDLNAKTEFDHLDAEQLASVCRDCQRCGLAQHRTQVVVGHGVIPADVMVIGEGPGEQEDLKGIPFVGRSGQLLTKIFESAGLDRDKDLFITNTVKCRPPQNRTPVSEEIEACRDYLIRQLQLIKPKVLLLVGAPALKTILGDTPSISKVRGQWVTMDVDYMESPLYVMPIFHPSYLLRQSSKEKGSPKWLTWQDMLEVKSALTFYRTSVAEAQS